MQLAVVTARRKNAQIGKTQTSTSIVEVKLGKRVDICTSIICAFFARQLPFCISTVYHIFDSLTLTLTLTLISHHIGSYLFTTYLVSATHISKVRHSIFGSWDVV